MQARNFPTIAVESLGEWPTGELRHLLANARIWKELRPSELPSAQSQTSCSRNSASAAPRTVPVLERLSRDQATALLARDADKSLILLSAREARRTPSGNHIDGNPGVDLERHLRQVASERGFADGGGALGKRKQAAGDRPLPSGCRDVVEQWPCPGVGARPAQQQGAGKQTDLSRALPVPARGDQRRVRQELRPV